MAQTNRLMNWNFAVPDASNLVDPIQQGMRDYRANQQRGIENQRADEQMGMQRERFGLEKQNAARQSEASEAKRIGGIARVIDGEQDPARRATMIQNLYKGSPAMAASLQKYGIDPNDHANVPKFLMAQAGSYDPLSEEAKRAQIEASRASAAAARANAGNIGLTDPIREFQFAKRSGFQGSFEDWRKQADARSNKFGLTPIPFERPDGTMGYMVPSTSGETRELAIPGGGRALPQATTVQTPTEVITRDRFGRDISRERKDLAGAEYDKVSGREAAQSSSSIPKLEAAYKNYETQQNIIVQDIEKALANTGWATTGAIGVLSRAVPGTAAADMARTLDTIKSNVGFDKLQAMRDASPTGGALGQVSEFENKLLQSVMGSLEQSQSGEQFVYNLRRLKDTITQMREQRKAALEADRSRASQRPVSPGAKPAPGAQPAAPSGGWSIRRLE